MTTKKIAKAKLYCLEERMKNRFFEGNSLRSQVRFWQPTENTWSLTIEFDKASEDGTFFWGQVWFGSYDLGAPQELLFVGNEIEFLEKDNAVVKIVVTEILTDIQQ
jgi:hypothetical protein